jgi:hypothetical protein
VGLPDFWQKAMGMECIMLLRRCVSLASCAKVLIEKQKLRKQVQAMVDNKELDGKDARTIFRDCPRKRSLLRGCGTMVSFQYCG